MKGCRETCSPGGQVVRTTLEYCLERERGNEGALERPSETCSGRPWMAEYRALCSLAEPREADQPWD